MLEWNADCSALMVWDKRREGVRLILLRQPTPDELAYLETIHPDLGLTELLDGYTWPC